MTKTISLGNSEQAISQQLENVLEMQFGLSLATFDPQIEVDRISCPIATRITKESLIRLADCSITYGDKEYVFVSIQPRRHYVDLVFEQA